MSKERFKAIVWFRNDLRLHDNESLCEAINAAKDIFPVYILDERIFSGKTRFGFRKTEVFRAKFILESIVDLKANLQALGSNLYVRVGKPEELIAALAKELATDWVFCNRERTEEEVLVQDRLEQNLWAIGQEMRFSRGKMLYYTSDLPFPVAHTPDIFSQFRKEVEKIVSIRSPLPSPQRLDAITENIDWGEIPSLEELGYDPLEKNDKGGYEWKGGETEALNQLDYYFHNTDNPSKYKETRNGLLCRDYSTKFSPWLACGCLSPKLIYSYLKSYEAKYGASESTHHIFLELMWRDFFRLMGKKHGNNIFKRKGTRKIEPSEKYTGEISLFRKWQEGVTGIPFIDANMRELKCTGFMSNRGRQNVASFLVKDLKINWQMGAEYFESMLIDYDPCSNYGNWNYLAGVGSDPQEYRYFNILSQAKRYDCEGVFVKYWLPVLQGIEGSKIHNLEQIDPKELTALGLTLGSDYPLPIVDTSRWLN